jgi:hypothetical protein
VPLPARNDPAIVEAALTQDLQAQHHVVDPKASEPFFMRYFSDPDKDFEIEILEHLQTRAIAEVAVRTWGGDYEHVRKDLRDATLFAMACRAPIDTGESVLMLADDDIDITYEMAWDAVHRNGSELQYVPRALMNDDASRNGYELCLRACSTSNVGKDGDDVVLQHVPERWRNQTMCEAAVRNDCRSLQDVPDAPGIDYPALCELAVTESHYGLRYVDRSRVDQATIERLYQRAVDVHGFDEVFMAQEDEVRGDIMRWRSRSLPQPASAAQPASSSSSASSSAPASSSASLPEWVDAPIRDWIEFHEGQGWPREHLIGLLEAHGRRIPENRHDWPGARQP